MIRERSGRYEVVVDGKVVAWAEATLPEMALRIWFRQVLRRLGLR